MKTVFVRGSSKAWTAVLAAGMVLVFVACGGGGGSSGVGDGTSLSEEPIESDPGDVDPADPEVGGADSPNPATELIVDAGYGRIVPRGAAVRLNATVEGDVAGLSWMQLAGTVVDLEDAAGTTPGFTAPDVAATETLVFELTAEDRTGSTASDRVEVEIWVPADGAADPTALGDFTDRPGWSCDVDPIVTPEVSMSEADGILTIAGSGVPAHTTGTFPNGGNPNAIATVSSAYSVPLAPVLTEIATEMAEFGVTLDGVKLERDTAESYQNAGQWRYEAITPGLALGATAAAEFSWLGTDCNNAHVQPTGAYHYHGIPEGLANRLDEGDAPTDMILAGWAADGHPFYIRYGYADPNDAESGLVALEASWELRSGARADGPGGAYDGTFREDWEFVEGSGDLDECGGRFGVTPEYPDGIYHYYLTDDYPYIPRCVFGTPHASFRAMGGARP